jgi:hypothetical protein
MADELESGEVVEREEIPGPELGETTEPETEEIAEGESVPEEKSEIKTFTQEELEAEIGKRLARERRKFEREQRQAAEPEPLKIESKLDPNQFQTTEAYLEALALEKAEAIIAHKERSKSVTEIDNKYQDAVDAALDKYPDFIQVAHTHPYMSSDMAAVIKASDNAVEMAYFLGSNLKEAERIFKLPPMMQIKELGKLEAKLEAAPPEPKKSSSAPPPIKPIQSGKATSPAYDTTDPRSVKAMSPSEWIAADRARRAKALAAKGYK